MAAAVVHRGLSAGINFLIVVNAGRAMSSTSFGSFAVLFATIAVILLPHSAFFSEPMLVYGPREYRPALRSYLMAAMIAQLWFGLLCSAAIAMTAIALDAWAVPHVTDMFALAAVVPLALSVDFLERSFFMQLRPFVPCISALLQITILAAFIFQKILPLSQSPERYLLAYATSQCFAVLFLCAAHVNSRAGYGRAVLATGEVLHRHASYGAWAAVSHLMLFMVTNFYLFLLPMLQNLTSTAVFRAQSAVTGPGAQAFSALGLIAVPVLRNALGTHTFLRELARFVVVISVSGILLTVGVGLFGQRLIDAIYAHKYALRPFGYWLAGAFPLAIGYAFIMGSALRSVDRPDLVAKAAGGTALVTLPLGIAMIRWQGVEGVILAQVVGAMAMALACCALLKRHYTPFDRNGQDQEARGAI